MPRRRTTGPYISRYPSRGKNSKWVVSTRTSDGRRKRRFFPTRELAESERSRIEDEEQFRRMTPTLRDEALECSARLAKVGKSLKDATNDYLKRLGMNESSPSVCFAIDRFLEVKEVTLKSGETRPRYVYDLRMRLKDFSKIFGLRQVCEIQPNDLDYYLKMNPREKPATRNGRLRVLSVFFAWCVIRGYAADNTAKRISRESEIQLKPKIFTPKQLSALLTVADSSIVPMIAIGAFAGLRTQELKSLTWNSLRLDEGVILVQGKDAKSRNKRSVPISKNLADWLCAYAPAVSLKHEGRQAVNVMPVNARTKLEAARDAAGLRESDGSRLRLCNHLRHSFAFYRLPLLKNPGAVAFEMGTHTAVLQSLYQELPDSDEVSTYWSITPATRMRIHGLV